MDITKVLEQFKERFPDEVIRTREGPSKKVGNTWKKQLFHYIPTDHLHERLDDVCGLHWTWQILGHSTVTVNKIVKTKVDKEDGSYAYVETPKTVEQVVVWGRLSILSADGLAIFFRDSFGGCDISYGSQAGDSFKIADSNAFKKACYKFGIGRYLGLEGLEEDAQLEQQDYGKKSNPYSAAKKVANTPKIFKNKQGATTGNPFAK